MCLGEYGTIVERLDGGRSLVRFADGAQRTVSLAVLVADHTEVDIGDVVAVSMGMALHVVDAPNLEAHEASRSRAEQSGEVVT